MDGITRTIVFVTVGVILGLFILGCFWVAKNVSYKLFYEAMVKRTVVEMVKPDALK